MMYCGVITMASAVVKFARRGSKHKISFFVTIFLTSFFDPVELTKKIVASFPGAGMSIAGPVLIAGWQVRGGTPERADSQVSTTISKRWPTGDLSHVCLEI